MMKTAANKRDISDETLNEADLDDDIYTPQSIIHVRK